MSNYNEEFVTYAEQVKSELVTALYSNTYTQELNAKIANVIGKASSIIAGAEENDDTTNSFLNSLAGLVKVDVFEGIKIFKSRKYSPC